MSSYETPTPQTLELKTPKQQLNINWGNPSDAVGLPVHTPKVNPTNKFNILKTVGVGISTIGIAAGLNYQLIEMVNVERKKNQELIETNQILIERQQQINYAQTVFAQCVQTYNAEMQRINEIK